MSLNRSPTKGWMRWWMNAVAICSGCRSRVSRRCCRETLSCCRSCFRCWRESGPLRPPPRDLLNVPDVQELRQRTFRALRELLARLSDRQPLVVWIDDLQWGDRDSSTFLAELCAPPQQPPLLLLLSYRSEEAGANTTLASLRQVLANQRLLGRLHDLGLAELSDAESRQLLHAFLPEDTLLAQEAEATIVHEASGHPLFLQQLARVAGLSGMAPDRTGAQRFTLKTALQDRVGALPPFAREVLQLTCLAAQPLTPAILFVAAEAGENEDRAEALALLIREKLARSRCRDRSGPASRTVSRPGTHGRGRFADAGPASSAACPIGAHPGAAARDRTTSPGDALSGGRGPPRRVRGSLESRPLCGEPIGL